MQLLVEFVVNARFNVLLCLDPQLWPNKINQLSYFTHLAFVCFTSVNLKGSQLTAAHNLLISKLQFFWKTFRMSFPNPPESNCCVFKKHFQIEQNIFPLSDFSVCECQKKFNFKRNKNLTSVSS